MNGGAGNYQKEKKKMAFQAGKLGAENDRNTRRDRRGFRARLALSGMGRKAEKYPIIWENY